MVIGGQTRDCQFGVSIRSLIMPAALLPTPDADVSAGQPTIGLLRNLRARFNTLGEHQVL